MNLIDALALTAAIIGAIGFIYGWLTLEGVL